MTLARTEVRVTIRAPAEGVAAASVLEGRQHQHSAERIAARVAETSVRRPRPLLRTLARLHSGVQMLRCELLSHDLGCTA